MKATQLQTVVSTAQASGTTLADLLTEVRKEWMAQRRSARPKRTPVQKAAAAKKAAATRAVNKEIEDRSDRIWREHCAAVERDVETLKAHIGPLLWQKYHDACLEKALSGDKDYTNLGVLREVLTAKGVKALKANGLDISKLTL